MMQRVPRLGTHQAAEAQHLNRLGVFAVWISLLAMRLGFEEFQKNLPFGSNDSARAPRRILSCTRCLVIECKQSTQL
jgi:hypothetical protein